MKGLAILTVLAGAAHADTITTEPLALVGRGITLGFERPIAPRFTLGGLAGFRSAAEGDFTSTTWTLGGELRWWRGRWFVGLHASAGRTSVHDDAMDAGIGATVELTERVDGGVRFVAGHHVAITPWLGIGMHHELGGRLASETTGVLAVGVELGWTL
jgi:hypothetical protein